MLICLILIRIVCAWIWNRILGAVWIQIKWYGPATLLCSGFLSFSSVPMWCQYQCAYVVPVPVCLSGAWTSVHMWCLYLSPLCFGCLVPVANGWYDDDRVEEGTSSNKKRTVWISFEAVLPWAGAELFRSQQPEPKNSVSVPAATASIFWQHRRLKKVCFD